MTLSARTKVSAALPVFPWDTLADATATARAHPDGIVDLSVGTPVDDVAPVIREALAAASASPGYPTTAGTPAVRASAVAALQRRYGVTDLPEHAVLPVIGTKEVIAWLPTLLGLGAADTVVVPELAYPTYDVGARLAGAQVLRADSLTQIGPQVPALVYINSPSNPTGKVLTMDEWQKLFELSDRYGFVIAADECYSEIYFDDAHLPIGGLEAATRLGRSDFRNVVMFSSLSKRSNVPGMRSGFVAGDAAILKRFLLYRTYHGCAMSPSVQAASAAAWNDEAHVAENRRQYREKFAVITPMLKAHLDVDLPDAGFYLWARVSGLGVSDTEFARRLQAEYNVTVLPGSFLAREAHGVNPGAGFVRIALVADLAECVEAASRIATFAQQLSNNP